MNYLELAKTVRAQAGISGEGPSNVSETVGIYGDVLRWVREAYNEVQTEYENWNFMHQQYDITLPNLFIEVGMPSEGARTIAKETFKTQFQLGDKKWLRYIPYSVWKLNDDLMLSAPEIKDPEHVTILPNDNLLFDSRPLEAIQILFEGYREPHIMVNSGDTPIFPVQYHQLIQFKALMKYGAFYNATEMYKANEVAYKELLSKMKYSELPKDNLYTPTFVPFA